MKTLRVTFDDKDYKKLEQAKERWKKRAVIEKTGWREYLLDMADRI